MKYKSLILLTGAFIVIAFASCKKDLLKANTNPDAVTANRYNPNFLFSSVQLAYTGSSDFGADDWQTKWGGVAGFIQHVASTNPAFYYGDKYLFSPGNEGELFDQAYTQQVQPLIECLELTQNKPQYANLHLMAEIMKALVFERITDTYGDIPYFQAGLGYYDRIYTPVFDKQQDIYMNMLSTVAGATDSLDDSPAADRPTGDLFYASVGSGQIDQWKKFGYSLLLRIAMRISNVDPTDAQKYAEMALGKTMTTNDDNAIVQHALGSAYQNRDAWSILQQDSADLKLDSTFITKMQVNKDPRLPVISWIYKGAKPADTIAADQIGMPGGYIVGGTNPAVDITKTKNYPGAVNRYSSINNDILNLTAPTLILTYGETELLWADAGEIFPGLGDGTSVATHYQNGVEASIEQFDAFPGVTMDAAAAVNYATVLHPLSTGGENMARNQINTEYWISTFMDEYESWANWRRTTYPTLNPTNYKGNTSNGTIPRRMQYPPDEAFSNGANENAAIARLKGGDTYIARVWWDTN